MQSSETQSSRLCQTKHEMGRQAHLTTSCDSRITEVTVYQLVESWCSRALVLFSSPLDPWSDQRPLLKCKLIKVKPSSLKLNHFKLGWLSSSLPPLHFSFPSLAHPHFRKTICHSRKIASICITDASFGLGLFPWRCHRTIARRWQQ